MMNDRVRAQLATAATRKRQVANNAIVAVVLMWVPLLSESTSLSDACNW